MRSGVYDVEFEILRDDCEPSLEDLSSYEEDWPPREMGVTLVRREDLVAFFYFYEIRTGESGLYWTSASAMADGDDPLEDFRFPLPSYPLFACPSPTHQVEFETRFWLSMVDPSTLLIRADTVWSGELLSCVDEDEYYPDPHLPSQACEESYQYRLTLREPCMPVNRCELHIGHRFTGINPWYGTPQFVCVCD